MRFKLSLLFCLISFVEILIGCGTSSFSKLTFHEIADLQWVPQDPQRIQGNLELSQTDQVSLKRIQNGFKKFYFAPWNQKLNSKDKIDLNPGTKIFHGANLLPYSKEWLAEVFRNASFDPALEVDFPGIIVRASDLRELPTHFPAFSNTQRAGSGFPFDLWQMNKIYVGTPVRICSYSKDRAWVYVETNDNDIQGGWVTVDSVSRLKPRQVQQIQKSTLSTLNTDQIAIYDSHKKFLFYSRIGIHLPILKKIQGGFIVQVPQRLKNGNTVFEQVYLPESLAQDHPLDINRNNMNQVAQKFLGTPYGWGNYLDYRDCSSMIKDFYSLFGIFFPRNSKQQIAKLKKTDLEQVPEEQKKKIILQQAIPYLTLVYAPGHIAIYVGHQAGEPVILQDIWAVRTNRGQEEGRNIIGRTILSTLQFGKEISDYSAQSSFYTRLQSLGFILNQD